jgi:hypothetical protein
MIRLVEDSVLEIIIIVVVVVAAGSGRCAVRVCTQAANL